MPKAVITAGRLQKMAVVVVLAQNQPERAAAMHGKTIFSFAFLISVSISQAANSQNLFDEKVKCQKLGEEYVRTSAIVGQYWFQTYKTNVHQKLGNCYLLIENTTANTELLEYKSNAYLFDGITHEQLAWAYYEKNKSNKKEIKTGMIYDKYYTGEFPYTYEIIWKYIDDKMITER